MKTFINKLNDMICSRCSDSNYCHHKGPINNFNLIKIINNSFYNNYFNNINMDSSILLLVVIFIILLIIII